jgi:hypothetical protein
LLAYALLVVLRAQAQQEQENEERENEEGEKGAVSSRRSD